MSPRNTRLLLAVLAVVLAISVAVVNATDERVHAIRLPRTFPGQPGDHHDAPPHIPRRLPYLKCGPAFRACRESENQLECLATEAAKIDDGHCNSFIAGAALCYAEVTVLGENCTAPTSLSAVRRCLRNLDQSTISEGCNATGLNMRRPRLFRPFPGGRSILKDRRTLTKEE